MVAEPAWIVFSESFLPPKLLEVRPIGNLHEHVIGLTIPQTFAFKVTQLK